jgi:hypothetical protein
MLGLIKYLELHKVTATWRKYDCANSPVPNMYLDSTDTSQRGLNSTASLWLSTGSKRNPIHVKPGQPFCVRVAVPPTKFGEVGEVFDIPARVHDHDESDVLVIWAYSETKGIRKVLNMKPWAGYQRSMNDSDTTQDVFSIPRDTIRIYEAEVQLYDTTYFQFDGFVEKHLGGLTSPWRIQKSQDMVIVDEFVPPHKWSLEARLSLPLCYGSDHNGRWVAKEKITFGTSMRPLKNKPTAFTVQRYDDQIAWLPYECKHKMTKLQSLRTCLQRTAKKVHWFVDNEDRGVYIRKLWSHGRWCSRQDAWRERCSCADAAYDWKKMKTAHHHIDIRLVNHTEFTDLSIEREGVLPGERVDHAPAPSFNMQTNDAGTAITDEIDPKITVIKFGGLSRAIKTDNYKMDPFESSYLDYLHDKEHFRTPGLVIFGLPLRDIKLLPFKEFDDRLTELIQNFKYRYSLLPIIYRSFRYSCCGKEGLTSDRIEKYELHTRKRVTEELGAEVWDIWTMERDWSTSADYIQNKQCRNSHSLSHGLIEAESHVLVNAICNELSG